MFLPMIEASIFPVVSSGNSDIDILVEYSTVLHGITQLQSFALVVESAVNFAIKNKELG